MKKLLPCLLLSLIFCSCASLTKPKSKFEICMDCLHYKYYGQAVINCKQATIDEPENYKAYSLLGLAYAELNMLEDALPCFNKAIKINPDDSFSWELKGAILIKFGLEKDGKECMEKARELKMQHPDK
jgi:tetratricopeptide (TPR) repeat protein